MAGRSEDRITHLERSLFGPAGDERDHPYWIAFNRRRRISRLYLAWRDGEVEKPELDDHQDQEMGERMEGYWRVAEELEEEGAWDAGKGSPGGGPADVRD
jgi:hypothetical protein